MKLSRTISGVVAGLLALLFLAAPVVAIAQQGTKVALLDISYIFQNNNLFKQTMDAMKADIEKFEEYVKGRRSALQGKAEGLSQFQVGSLEYKRAEAALAKESADLQVEIGLKKKDIMEREARVFYEAYSEIERHVAHISAQRNYGLVLRYNSTKIDGQDRASVLQGVNRSIVYQNQLDITQIVLDSINSRSAPPIAGGGTPTARQQIPQRPNR